MTLHGQNSKGFEKFLRFAALVAYVVLNRHFIFGSFLLHWQLFAGLRRLRSESGGQVLDFFQRLLTYE